MWTHLASWVKLLFSLLWTMIRISWGYIYNHILPDINLSHNFLFRQEPISQHHVDGKLCDMVGGEPGDTAGQRGDTRPVTESTNERPCVPALVTRSTNQKTRVPALLTLATNQSKEGQKGTKETNPTNMFYCLLVWCVYISGLFSHHSQNTRQNTTKGHCCLHAIASANGIKTREVSQLDSTQ